VVRAKRRPSRTIKEAKPSAAICQFAVIPQWLFCGRLWPITSIRADLISNSRMQTDSRIKLWVVWVEVVETGLRGFDIPVFRWSMLAGRIFQTRPEYFKRLWKSGKRYGRIEYSIQGWKP
jgi:hypothetical protein